MKHLLLSALLACATAIAASATPPLLSEPPSQPTSLSVKEFPITQPRTSSDSEETDTNWKSLGYGTYHNSFFFDNDYAVEVEQNLSNPAQFRLVAPYTPGYQNEGYNVENPPEYVEFQIVGPGNTIPTTDLTVPYYYYFLYIPSYNTGYYHKTYKDYIYALYGADLSPVSLENFYGQMVLYWTKTPSSYSGTFDGMPSKISMGACHYLYSESNGWFNQKSSNQITFTFPDSSLAPTVEAKVIKDGATDGINYSITFDGSAIDHVLIGCVKMESNIDALAPESVEAAIASVKDGSAVKSITVTNNTQGQFIPTESGLYMIAAIAYDAVGTPFVSSYDFATFDTDAVNYSWKSLGKGNFYNSYFSRNSYPVEVQQDITRLDHYRLVNPYAEMLDDSSNLAPYIEFYLVAPEETIPGSDDSNPFDDGVTFTSVTTHPTGYTHPYYGNETWMAYHDYMKSKKTSSYTTYYGQYVQYWQKAPDYAVGDRGIPDVVGMSGCMVVSVSEGGVASYYNVTSTFEFPDLISDLSLGDLNFSIISTDEKTVQVYKNGYPKGDIVIPSTVTIDGDTYTVVAVKERGFASCADIVSVTLPESVNTIGESAFSHCTSLTNINIPAAVTELPQSVFSYCGFTSFDVPATIKTIGAWAFGACALESVTLHEGLTTIYAQAFAHTELTSLDIPASVTLIGGSEPDAAAPFYWVPDLEAINVASDNTSYASIDGVLFNKGITEVLRYPTAKAATSYTIPETVKKIHDSAFSDFYGNGSLLEEVIFPDGLEEIGPYAFSNFTKSHLKEINLPNTVTTVGAYAFHGSTNVTKLTLSNSLTEIAEAAFTCLMSITELEVPEGIEKIGAWGFGELTSVTKVKLPKSLVSLGQYAFGYARSLEEVSCDNPEPPVCHSIAFYNTDVTSVTLSVPSESVELYRNADVWKDFMIVSAASNPGVAADEADCQVTVTDGGIKVSGVAAGTRVEVYSVTGALVYSGTSGTISLSPGVYVVRVANRAFRVAVH